MITLDIRRWKLGELVGASVAYWAVLAATALAPFSRVVYSIARLGNNRGTATGSFTNHEVTLTALKDGVAVYTASASLLQIALWVALPPLGLWLVWIASRPSRARARELDAQAARDALPDPARNGFSDRAAMASGDAQVHRRETRG